MTRSVFRPSSAIAVRGVGVGAVVVGVAVVGYTVLRMTDLSGAASTALTVLAAVVAALGLVVLVVGIVRLAGGGTRLVLDDEGFVNATGPGAGVRTGRWADVRKVQTDGAVVSIDLAGGRQSIVRTRALDVDSRELARELRARLRG